MSLQSTTPSKSRLFLNIDGLALLALVACLLLMFVCVRAYIAPDSTDLRFHTRNAAFVFEQFVSGNFIPRWNPLAHAGAGEASFDHYGPVSYIVPALWQWMGFGPTLALLYAFTTCFAVGVTILLALPSPAEFRYRALAALGLGTSSAAVFLAYYVQGYAAYFASVLSLCGLVLLAGNDGSSRRLSRPLFAILFFATAFAGHLLTAGIVLLSFVLPACFFYIRAGRWTALKDVLAIVGIAFLIALPFSVQPVYFARFLDLAHYARDIRWQDSFALPLISMHFSRPWWISVQMVSMGVPLLLVLCGGIWRAMKPGDPVHRTLAAASAICAFAALDFSYPLWAAFPSIADKLQTPLRFVFPALIGWAAHVFLAGRGFLPRRVAWIEFAVLLVLPPAIGFLHLHKNVDQTPDAIQMEPDTLAGYNKNFVPLNFSVPGEPAPDLARECRANAVSCRSAVEGGTQRVISVESDHTIQALPLAVACYTTLAGRVAPENGASVHCANGQFVLSAPPGRHVVRIAWVGAPVYTFFWAGSALGIALMLVLLWRMRARRR